MREILFRGQSIDRREWYEGNLYQTMSNVCFIDYYTESGDGMAVEVEPETVGQYTGLADKNGTKIFEGDIVRVILPHFPTTIGVVKYHKDFFGVYIKDVTPTQHCIDYIIKNGTVEVIGNIYDNPELLGGGEE